MESTDPVCCMYVACIIKGHAVLQLLMLAANAVTQLHFCWMHDQPQGHTVLYDVATCLNKGQVEADSQACELLRYRVCCNTGWGGALC